MTIAEFVKDTRLQNLLYGSGITTVKELLNLSDQQLLIAVEYSSRSAEQVKRLLSGSSLK